MKPLSLQDIFNAAWKRFVVDCGQPSLCLKSCVYDDDCGNRCAVGCALPEELIQKIKSSNKNSGFSFPMLYKDYPEYFDDSVKTLLYEEGVFFQAYLHDNLMDELGKTDNKSRIIVEGSYRVVAHRYGLTVPEETSSVLKD